MSMQNSICGHGQLKGGLGYQEKIMGLEFIFQKLVARLWVNSQITKLRQMCRPLQFHKIHNMLQHFDKEHTLTLTGEISGRFTPVCMVCQR